MGYKIDFKQVLLSGWEAWDTGRYDIPGKNVVLKDGTIGCVLISEEGASVYKKPLLTVNDEDMGMHFEAMSELKEGETDTLHLYLTDEIISEVLIVFEKYNEHENSYTD